MKSSSIQSGFSLVETLVAITILLLVIIGPLAISASTAKSTGFASEQVVAFFLAQEGVELVQKYRDDLLLEHFATPGTPWADFTDASGALLLCMRPQGCGLEILNTGALATPTLCSSVNCKLYLDLSAGDNRARYTHDSSGHIPATPFAGTKPITPYTRSIQLIPDIAGREVRVVSRVTWRTGSIRAEQVAEVESYLFNIYETP